MTTKELCVICHEPMNTYSTPNWVGGHNAQPVAEGQCCTDCNIELVIPARMEQVFALIETGGKGVN